MAQDEVVRRHPSHVDWVRVDRVVGLVIAVAIGLQAGLGSGPRGLAASAPGGLVIGLAVAFRRRFPLAGPMVFLAGWTAQTFLGNGGSLHGSAAAGPGLLLLFYGMGAFASDRRGYWGLAVAVSVGSINTLHRPGTPVTSVPLIVLFVTVLPWGLGRMMRARALRVDVDRQVAERIDAARDATALIAAYDERTRIARELHDVIAHSVSVMVIQAGGARMVMETDPDRAEASLLSVERAGRDALAEMRRLLGLFDRGDSAALAPQPGLADIDGLIEHARQSGVVVALRVDGDRVALAPAIELCAYRVVQEALTNVIKHAAGARAEVRVSWGDSLQLVVCDDGHGLAALDGTSGHGLAGMRERVAMYGGCLDTGHNAGGGFTVHASLPIARESAR